MSRPDTLNVSRIPAELMPRLRDRVEIEMEQDGKLFRFVSTVADLDGEDIILDYPEAVEGGGVLMVGDYIRVGFIRCDGIYSYGSQVLEKDPNSRIRPMRIRGPQRLERLQRRRFVRVDLSGQCSWWSMNKSGQDTTKPIFGEKHTGVLRNFSAGGILFAADDPPESHDIILVDPRPEGLNLDGRIVATVIRAQRSDDAAPFSHLVAICFRGVEEITSSWTESKRAKWPEDAVGVTPFIQQKLINFVYRVQIDMRSKGLL